MAIMKVYFRWGKCDHSLIEKSLENNEFSYRVQKIHVGLQPAGHLPTVFFLKLNVNGKIDFFVF